MNRVYFMVRPGLLVVLAIVMGAVCAHGQTTKPTTTKPVEPANGVILLEGFENVGELKGDGKLTAVNKNVTQGDAALQLPPKGSVQIVIKRKNMMLPYWLKFDTFQADPVSHPLMVQFSAPRTPDLPCIVKAGKDTVAIPLSVVSPSEEGERPQETTTLYIRNTGDTPLIIDNVRLQPPFAWPKDRIALDPGSTFVWPGFRRETGQHLKGWLSERSTGYPDPLLGDFTGPYPSFRAQQKITLNVPGKGQQMIYFWFRHISHAWMEAIEYSVTINNNTLLKKGYSARQMLSSDGKAGLMIGMGGEWTPGWYDTTYAPSFCDAVKVNLNGGSSYQMELLNTSVAAMIIGPASEKVALKDAVDQLKEDLATYRRQFIVGRVMEPSCTFGPDNAEIKAGLIVLPAPADALFGPAWQPQPTEDTRLTKLDATAYSGQTVVMTLAAVPLKKGPVAATLGAFKSADGAKTLPMARSAEAYFVQRLPRVLDATAYQQPWVLRNKFTASKPGEIVPIALMLSIAPGAPEGVYSGQIKLTAAGGTGTIMPIEITVHAIVTPGNGESPTFGLAGNTTAADMYGPVALSKDPKEQEKITREIRQEFIKLGFNAMILPGPYFKGNPVDDSDFTTAMKMLGPKACTGWGLLDLDGIHNQMRDRDMAAGSRGYNSAMSQIVQKTESVVQKTDMAGLYDVVGGIWASRQFGDMCQRGSAVLSVKGKPAVYINSHTLAPMSDEDVKKLRESFSALLVLPNYQKPWPKIEAFIKTAKGDAPHDVYFVFHTPDVYAMGFYTFAMEAKGWYVNSLFMRPGPYSGFGFDGSGLLVPDTDMWQFSPTLGILRARQGQSDYLLARRAAEVVAAATKAGVDAGDLSAILGTIRDKARGLENINPDRVELQTKVYTAKELDDLREKLINATADLIKKLPKK